MKKLSIIVVFVLLAFVWSCSDVRREPGRVYIPDMQYSRALETYSPLDTLEKQGIHYNAMPVPGTIKRGALFPFPIAKDKTGDTTNYVLAKQVQDPVPALDAGQMKEAERLYLVNCGICHGMKLDGNGPLYNSGNGPFAAAPKNLIGDAVVSVMPEGQMFYSITYGKNMMGSYASQLSSDQRWMVIKYIKSKQAAAKGGGGGSSSATDSTAKKTDSAAKK